MLKDQPPLMMDGNVVDSTKAALSVGPPRVDASNNVSPSHTQAVYHGGHDDMIGRWGTCFPDINVNCSHGIYSDSLSLPFQVYPQMPQRSYSPFMTQPPSISCHGQFYDLQELPDSDSHYHQQLVSPKFVASQNPFSQTKLPINIEQHGDCKQLCSRPLCTLGSLRDGSNFCRRSGDFKFLQQGFGPFESGDLWSDLSKSSTERSSLWNFSSRAACPKQIGSLDLSVNHCGMVFQQKELSYGPGSHLSSSYGCGPQDLNDHDLGHDVWPSSVFGTNGRNWLTFHEARQRGRCSDFSCSCTIALDTLSERNRGPRAFKPRSQATENASVANDHQKAVADVQGESYNQLDFVTDFKDAKFFVIKSYSEDNVHKSIKYGVWASTPNGNKKLDAAYRKAKEKHWPSPIFLLFSVNASAQFCGVAEMIGPVDFDKSVNFWQQDKWSGQFPVRWRIIKDVPNSRFRHIVLENNDSKPVTNSRDTQEVELQQGVEMLGIFKNFDSHCSILDDFHFYEERQRVMQLRKLRPQMSPVSTPTMGDGEQNPVPFAGDLIKKMSNCFSGGEWKG